MAEQHHIAIMTSPGRSHLIPAIELAKKLVPHNFTITIIVPTVAPVPKYLTTHLQALPQGMDYILLPPIEFHDQNEIASENRVVLTLIRSLPSIHNALNSLVEKTPLSALIVDMFGVHAIDFASQLNIPSYIFCLTAITSISLLYYMPMLDKMVSCQFFEHVSEPIKIPGFEHTISGSEIPDVLQNRESQSYNAFLSYPELFRSAKGILINSFTDLEPGTAKALKDKCETESIPTLYTVGPLVPTRSVSDEFECLRWLDEQQSGSVLFVSFGSGGTLSNVQFTELAFGLELSGQKFIWVVKIPNDKSSKAEFYSSQSDEDDPLSYLPLGFIDRIKGRGFVVSNWAPQVEILSNGSTGGFLTHCGWNSILESVVHGVPLIAWPLFAEQKMNAVILSDDLRVALRPKADSNGVVGRDEVAKTVKRLMAGDEGVMMRDRMMKLKELAAKTFTEEGSSTNAFSELALNLKNKSI